jgi:DNA-binding transcriptional regulator YdaS (Cro superfamily)
MEMDIRQYLMQPERGLAARLARELGVSPVVVSRWKKQRDEKGWKAVPLYRCAEVERATNGQVPRWKLRPLDWPIHWPELIGSPGAPGLPAETAQTA